MTDSEQPPSFEAIDAQTQSVYQEHATTYDSQRDKSLFERLYLDQLLQRIQPTRSVLDLGCGAGEPIARYLIEQNCRLTGVDYAPAMIDFCKQRFPQHNWFVGDMRKPDFPESYDAIISWGAFFHLTPDQQRSSLPVLCQTLKPRGLLLITVGHMAGEVTGTVAGKQVYHSSLSKQEYTEILEAHELQVLEFNLADENCRGFSVFLAQKRAAMPGVAI